MSNSLRMSWVDMAKGLSIILVVAMYSAYNTGEYTGAVGFLHYFIGFATPFRMPEFFLISGLFLSQVIARPWQRYADRRVLHYFYFYALWAFIMIVLKVGTLRARARRHAPGDSRWPSSSRTACCGSSTCSPSSASPSNCCGNCACRTGWSFRSPPACRWRTSKCCSYVVTQFAGYFVFFYVGYAAAPVVFVSSTGPSTM